MFENMGDRSTLEQILGIEFVEIISFTPDFIILSKALFTRIA
jgi:hypothetical protein